MFQKNLSKQSIVHQLGPVISVFEEKIIPSQVELLNNNHYAENYAWMYSFEKRLKYRIEELLGHKFTYNQERILFGAGGAVSEGMSNGFAHGHKKDKELPFTIWVSVSQKGLGFAITDSGAGFDFDEVYTSFKRGESFYNVAGNGFPLLHNSKEFFACFQKHGTQLCLLCPLSAVGP